MPKLFSRKPKNIFWYFPSTSHGEEHGFADSLLEYFQGDHEKYIARETIQNAVDARLEADKPVRVAFERFDVGIAEFPGSKDFQSRIKRCLENMKGQHKAIQFFTNAQEVLRGEKLSVLKISDYNTVGLSGADDDNTGNWYRLVRATGTSSPKGATGGSFGIGKGAPIAASVLRTVFYSSVNDRGEAVFQGKARLVSHKDETSDMRQGVGFYGIEGYRAVRDSKQIPDLFRRRQRGTDIFIMGYVSDENWQSDLIRSVLGNFWLAILNGDLEVSVKDGEEIIISKDTLAERLEEFDAEDAKRYFETVTQPTQRFDEELRHLGHVTLYVKKQDGYPSKVMMARKPKMLVQEKAYRSLREPYAGVFVCEDERGNSLLRDLEPPAHDKWDRYRGAKNGWAALVELDEFIKNKLKSMAGDNLHEPQDIPGLDRYLPDSENRDEELAEKPEFAEPTSKQEEQESGREVGASKEPAAREVERTVRRATVVKNTASGEAPGKKSNTGGNAKGDKSRIPSGASDEEGKDANKRINTGDISFRSFVQKTSEGIEYRFVISGKEETDGAVRIVAVGDDGSYPVDVKSATDTDSKQQYEIAGSLIKNLHVRPGQSLKLAVRLNTPKKYAVGIESYEG